MQLVSPNQSEIRATLETCIELINELDTPDIDVRAKLDEQGFTRAANASDASIKRLATRLAALAPLVQQLPDLDPDDAATRINEELTELAIAPAVVDHNGVGPHMHWTPATATFDKQVMADIVMAIAQELCDSGTIRFGRCGADNCEDLFYDGTRNRSRRFCPDPKCASRTHTADFRARKRS